MINAIKYYYDINITEVHQKYNKYRFKLYNENYILHPYEGTNEEMKEIYNLNIYLETNGVLCHRIILNNEGNILTNINGIYYILLKLKIENRKIQLADMLYLSNIYIDSKAFKMLRRDNWSILWSKKIDYIEYQANQLKKKYKIIDKSIDYYIGIVENCIQMLNIEIKEETLKTITHRRINKNDTTEDFYNPVNFIIDNRVRDISEYVKTYMIENIDVIKYIEKFIISSKLNPDEIKLLFIRIFYPSGYFDKCDKILEYKMEENILECELKNIEKQEQEIEKIYNYLKKYITMPEIEWIKKRLSNIDNTFYFRNFI